MVSIALYPVTFDSYVLGLQPPVRQIVDKTLWGFCLGLLSGVVLNVWYSAEDDAWFWTEQMF